MANYDAGVSYDLQPPGVRNAIYAQHSLHPSKKPTFATMSKKECNAAYAQHLLQHVIHVNPNPKPESKKKSSPKPESKKKSSPKPSQKVTFAKFHNIALKVDSKYQENENRIREKYDNKERFMKVISKIKGINDGDIVFTGKRESDTFFWWIFMFYYSQGF